MPVSFYLVDGNAYAYQSFYSIHDLYSPDGTPTNAVYGFIRMIQKIIQNQKPDYLAVCFDMHAKVFRQDWFPEYKANRKPMPDPLRPQIPLLKEILAAYPIAVFGKEGFEADDVIATLAKKGAALGWNVFIASPDKDIAQIMTEQISIFDPKDETIVGKAEIEAKYHLRISQMIDYFALTGDECDNIPGVCGIGPKKAVKLLEDWASLDNLYANLDRVEPKRTRECLAGHKEDAFLSQKLFRIDDEVKLDFEESRCKTPFVPSDKLLAWYQKLGFRTLVQDIMERLPQKAIPSIQAVATRADLTKLVEKLKKENEIVVDVDMEEGYAWQARLKGLVFGWGEQSAYVDCSDIAILQDIILTLLNPILSDGPKKIGHDLKKIYEALKTQGITLYPLGFDTMLAGSLLTANKKTDLETLGREYLAFPGVTAEDSKELAWAKRVYTIQGLATKLPTLLEEHALIDFLSGVEMPLIPVFVEMELAGISLREKNFRSLLANMEKDLLTLAGKIYDASGEKFKITSSKALEHILFDKLALPKIKKTQSTRDSVLEVLREKHPLPGLILDYRALETRLAQCEEIVSQGKAPHCKIHSVYNTTTNALGEITCETPWLSLFPEILTSPEKFFQASPGYALMRARYGEIVGHLLYHVSLDPMLLKDLQSGTSLPKSAEELEPFYSRYPALATWREGFLGQARKDKYIQTFAKIRKYFPEIQSGDEGMSKNAERAALSFFLQGSISDIIKKALLRLYQKRNEKMLPIRIVAQMEDEIWLEILETELEVSKIWIRDEMQAIEMALPLEAQVLPIVP